MIGTPSSLVAEGIAGLASEILLGDEEERVLTGHLAAPASSTTPISPARAKKVSRPLGHVGRERRAAGPHARRFRGGGVRLPDEAGVCAPRSVPKQMIRFVTDPVWGSYVSTYTDGYKLCRLQGSSAATRRASSAS